MNLVVLGVGSNISPKGNIEKAKRLLSESHRLLKSSTFILTKPIGDPRQADFLNGAFLLETSFSQDQLQRWLKKAEESLGRDRQAPPGGPRTIDLDIVVWNGKIVDPDFYERDFLRKAVLELIPDLITTPKPRPI